MTSFESTLPPPPKSRDEPYSYPLARPDPSSKPLPPKELTPEQQEKHANLIAHFNQPDFKLPNSLKTLKAHWAARGGGGGSRFGGLFGRSSTPLPEESELHPLTDVEKCYWSSQAFLRCLRAVKWDYAAAVRRAEETCVWRREYNVEGMKEEDVWREGETGKELVLGYDVDCRPVLYMHPYRQNTQTGPDQIAFVVWCLERTIDLAPPTDPATEMLCLCIDFGANLKDTKSQPTTLGQARKVLEILQTYYCERLGKAVCVNIPQIFFAFYRLVSPFVDPITKEKIRFLDKPDATSLIPPQQLQTIFGGDINLQYDHSVYFPALTKLCMERKAANLNRWRKWGEGRCGLDEAVVRGAREPSGSGAQKTKLDDEEAQKVPPTEELAAASLHDSGHDSVEQDKNAASAGGSPEGTVVADEPGTSRGSGDKFVDAPVASASAVEKAAPALTTA